MGALKWWVYLAIVYSCHTEELCLKFSSVSIKLFGVMHTLPFWITNVFQSNGEFWQCFSAAGVLLKLHNLIATSRMVCMTIEILSLVACLTRLWTCFGVFFVYSCALKHAKLSNTITMRNTDVFFAVDPISA